MGTPDFAVPALEALIGSAHEVIAVYTQPPRPKGRGHKLQSSPVHICAEKHNIPVYTPKKLKKNEVAIEEFQSLDADIAVVAAYGLILPKTVLEAPKYGCFNIHASLLPRWRGAAPIQYAIWKGDEKSGVTIMQMEQGLDTGPMIAKEETSITDETTALSLHDKLSSIGANMIVKTIDQLSEGGKINSEPQNDALSGYASMLKKEDGQIDWSKNAQEIDRQIRALNPWPGTYFQNNGDTFKVKKAKYIAEKSQEINGTLLNNLGYVSCGDNTVLYLESIQAPNGKTMDIPSAINGGYIRAGDRFTS